MSDLVTTLRPLVHSRCSSVVTCSLSSSHFFSFHSTSVFDARVTPVALHRGFTLGISERRSTSPTAIPKVLNPESALRLDEGDGWRQVRISPESLRESLNERWNGGAKAE